MCYTKKTNCILPFESIELTTLGFNSSVIALQVSKRLLVNAIGLKESCYIRNYIFEQTNHAKLQLRIRLRFQGNDNGVTLKLS